MRGFDLRGWVEVGSGALRLVLGQPLLAGMRSDLQGRKRRAALHSCQDLGLIFIYTSWISDLPQLTSMPLPCLPAGVWAR